MILVGSSAAVSRALVDGPLFTAQAARYAIATALLLLIGLVGRQRVVMPRGREWLWLIGIAATGLVLFNVAVVRGVAHAEPAVIAVAVACAPILIGVIGPFMQHHQPRGALVLGAGVVTVGAIVVEGTGRTDATGVFWAAVALICEAAFTLLAIPVLGRHGAFGVSVHAVWIGTVLFAVLGFSIEGPSAIGRLSGANWAAIGYLAVMVTATAFLLWYLGRPCPRSRCGRPADRDRAGLGGGGGDHRWHQGAGVVGLGGHGRDSVSGWASVCPRGRARRPLPARAGQPRSTLMARSYRRDSPGSRTGSTPAARASARPEITGALAGSMPST